MRTVTRWGVYDANQDPEHIIAQTNRKEDAQQLRRLYLQAHPDADPSWVYVASDEDGLTLVEALVVLFIMGVAGSIMVAALVTGTRLSVQTAQRAHAVSEAQIAVDRLLGDLSRADTVTMTRDVCAEGVVFEVDGEEYAWWWEAGRLQRSTGSTVTADRPEVFAWYDVDDVRLDGCAGDPWRVEVSVVVEYAEGREIVRAGSVVVP